MRRGAAGTMVVSVLAAAGVAGCGGGDDDGPALSESAYRSKVNAVCTTLKRDNEAALKGVAPGDRDAVAKATQKVGEQTRTALDRIDDLEGPDRVEDATDRFVDLAEDFGEKASKVRDASELTRLSQDVRTAAQAAGLDACAS